MLILGMLRRIPFGLHRVISTSSVLARPRFGQDHPDASVERFNQRPDRKDPSDHDMTTFDAANSNEPRGRDSHRRWVKREEFYQRLQAEGGLDDPDSISAGDAPLDRRAASDVIERRVDRHRQIAMKEMARRKYYDFPVEDNLLTWAAKEQIFQLRASNPEIWTPERIAESFPISIEAARRLLKRLWPPDPTGEDLDDVIRKHDDDVRRRWILLKKGKTKDGLLSETTLHMIRSGQVKFLPMFASGNSSVSEGEEESKKDEFTSTIAPQDGPFVRLYKTHLQYVERTSSKSTPTAQADALVKKDLDAGQLLRAYVFPEDQPGMENVAMPYQQFRRQLQVSLRRRGKPEDKKFLDWMARNEPKKNDTDSGTVSG